MPETQTPLRTLADVHPDAPALAVAVNAALVAAGFVYSAPSDPTAPPRPASWPTGFMLDWREDADSVTVAHWDDAYMPWFETTPAQRAAYRTTLDLYRAALAADECLMVHEFVNAPGRAELVVRLREGR